MLRAMRLILHDAAEIEGAISIPRLHLAAVLAEQDEPEVAEAKRPRETFSGDPSLIGR